MTQHAYQGDVVVWSDDGGRSFNHSDSLHLKGLDEWQMVELSNYSMLAIMRNCADASGHLHKCRMARAAAERNYESGGAADDSYDHSGGTDCEGSPCSCGALDRWWCFVLPTTSASGSGGAQ